MENATTYFSNVSENLQENQSLKVVFQKDCALHLSLF